MSGEKWGVAVGRLVAVTGADRIADDLDRAGRRGRGQHARPRVQLETGELRHPHHRLGRLEDRHGMVRVGQPVGERVEVHPGRGGGEDLHRLAIDDHLGAVFSEGELAVGRGAVKAEGDRRGGPFKARHAVLGRKASDVPDVRVGRGHRHRQPSPPEAEAKKILALKTAEGAGIKAVLEGRAEGFRQLVQSSGGNSNQAVVVLLADQLPEMIDAQMKGISNLKIDKIVVWGGGEGNGKGGISALLKDLITGLPPVTELARAAGVELPPVLGKVGSAIADGPSPATAATYSHPSQPNGTPAAPDPRA